MHLELFAGMLGQRVRIKDAYEGRGQLSVISIVCSILCKGRLSRPERMTAFLYSPELSRWVKRGTT